MVRKIGQFLLSGGGLVATPLSILHLSNFRDKMVAPIGKIFVMDRCPKDVPTTKNLVWNKSSPHSREKLENLLGCGIPTPWPLDGN